jgi:hypothetical protein
MRTTLDIDDDVLALAKEMASKERRTAGSVISALARQGYHATGTGELRASRLRNGVRMLPNRSRPVTLSHVEKLMEQEGL